MSSGGLKWAMAAVVVVALGLGLWLLVGPRRPVEPNLAARHYSDFNLPEAPNAESGPVVQYTSKFESESQARLARSGEGWKGLAPEPAGRVAPSPSGARPAGGPAQERERELSMIRAYDAQFKAYQDSLARMTDKYWERYPIVRQVDAEFGRLERYMALKRQYERDRDPYKWARSVVALPEVRQTIGKYALKPEVWAVGFRIMLEALRSPPPQPIFDEMRRFMTNDRAMTDYGSQFAGQLVPHVGRLAPQAIPPGEDIGPLLKLVTELKPPDVSTAVAEGGFEPKPREPGRR